MRLWLCMIWILLFSVPSFCQQVRHIPKSVLTDKLHGFWVGQMLGNFIGRPFEHRYVETPMPILVTKIYSFEDALERDLLANDNHAGGYIPILAGVLDGAFSDDDTDIEIVTLHAVEKYGLTLTYEEITEAWTTHINGFIWAANREARTLMDSGIFPPDTGKRKFNKHWYKIDAQLTNEIWSAFFPGMISNATERAEWGASITNDGWAIHPTIVYSAMISAAFFESDVRALVNIGLDAIPTDSPVAMGIRDLLEWHYVHSDWRKTRKLLHEKYYQFQTSEYSLPVHPVSALINGLSGIMAVLYGEGDFLKTVSIATSAGYDCDNQAATSGGLMGVMSGITGMSDQVIGLTKTLPAWKSWDSPFNDTYVNITRDQLPSRMKISSIVDRTVDIAEKAIVRNGGRISTQNGRVFYSIVSDVPFKDI